jgi:protein-tyrosine phosphatase
MIKSRRMRWAGHVARMGEEELRFWWESWKERDYYEELDVGGRKILKWI